MNIHYRHNSIPSLIGHLNSGIERMSCDSFFTRGLCSAISPYAISSRLWRSPEVLPNAIYANHDANVDCRRRQTVDTALKLDALARTTRSEESCDSLLTLKGLASLHEAIMRKCGKENGGRLRWYEAHLENQAGGFLAADPKRIEKELERFLDEARGAYKRHGSSPGLAMITSLILVLIHPFADGNGRLARIVCELIGNESGTGVPLSIVYWFQAGRSMLYSVLPQLASRPDLLNWHMDRVVSGVNRLSSALFTCGKRYEAEWTNGNSWSPECLSFAASINLPEFEFIQRSQSLNANEREFISKTFEQVCSTNHNGGVDITYVNKSLLVHTDLLIPHIFKVI